MHSATWSRAHQISARAENWSSSRRIGSNNHLNQLKPLKPCENQLKQIKTFKTVKKLKNTSETADRDISNAKWQSPLLEPALFFSGWETNPLAGKPTLRLRNKISRPICCKIPCRCETYEIHWDCLGPQLFGICLELDFIPQLLCSRIKSKFDAMKVFTTFIFATKTISWVLNFYSPHEK